MGGGWLGLALMVALSLVAIATVEDRLAVGVLAASFAAPPLALWAFAQVVPSFVDRYVICSTVALLGLACLGLGAVRRPVAVALLGVLVGVGLVQVARTERARFKYEDPPGVAAYISARTQPGDAIGFGSGGLRTVIDMYVGAGRPFPADVAVAPGGQAWRQDDAYAREVGPDALAARLAGVGRLWLVTDPTDHGYPSSGPFAALRGAYRRGAVVAFPGMDVALYTR